MEMTTAGHSEGGSVTAWRTRITDPDRRNFLVGKPDYEAIECQYAPKQGRSGGGLFTNDGYLAGVCNFAEPVGNQGIYASPRSIYVFLDRNGLMVEETTCRLFRRIFGGNNVQVNVNPPNTVVAPTIPSTVTPIQPTPTPVIPPVPVVINPPAMVDLSGIEARLGALEGQMGSVTVTLSNLVGITNTHTRMLNRPITFVTPGPSGPISVQKRLGDTLTLNPFNVPGSATTVTVNPPSAGVVAVPSVVPSPSIVPSTIPSPVPSPPVASPPSP